VPKKLNLHKNELNTTFFCSTSLLKAPNRLKSLKLAWRFVLTCCDIYQNPFTQEKFLKFWQCRKKILKIHCKRFQSRGVVRCCRIRQVKILNPIMVKTRRPNTAGCLNPRDIIFRAKCTCYSRHGDIVIMYSVPYLTSITIVTVSEFGL
jgi:hypothetical protein